MAKNCFRQPELLADIPAGPSEVMIAVDQCCRPEITAADMLSQAEHGPDSQVVVLMKV